MSHHPDRLIDLIPQTSDLSVFMRPLAIQPGQRDTIGLLCQVPNRQPCPCTHILLWNHLPLY